MKDLYFLHVPKTGGHYLNRKILAHSESVLKTKYHNDLETRSGHGGWVDISDDSYVISAIRDPAYRTVSHFAYFPALLQKERYEEDSDRKYVRSLFEWVDEKKDFIANYQSKNFLFGRPVPKEFKIFEDEFFLHEKGFLSIKDIDKDLLYERLNRTNILLRSTQLNDANTSLIADQVALDAGISHNPCRCGRTEMPVIAEPMDEPDNANKVSRDIFNRLTEKEIEYLREISSIDYEVYMNDTLFWNNGQ
jgi:hypothetical protein